MLLNAKIIDAHATLGLLLRHGGARRRPGQEFSFTTADLGHTHATPPPPPWTIGTP